MAAFFSKNPPLRSIFVLSCISFQETFCSYPGFGMWSYFESVRSCFHNPSFAKGVGLLQQSKLLEQPELNLNRAVFSSLLECRFLVLIFESKCCISRKLFQWPYFTEKIIVFVDILMFDLVISNKQY